jgi:hypothetical protein
MSDIVDALSSGASMLARPVLLAAGTSGTTGGTQPGGQGQEFGSASTLGFVVLVLFFIGVAFLARSMAKHLKRAQKNLGTDDGAPAEGQFDDRFGGDPADDDRPQSYTGASSSESALSSESVGASTASTQSTASAQSAEKRSESAEAASSQPAEPAAAVPSSAPASSPSTPEQS